MRNIIVIGIAGGTGSGKTTLIKRIKKEFNDDVAIISHDFYYKEYSHLPFEDRKKLNYDHPNAFDTSLMVEHIRQLVMGKAVQRPVYDFVNYCRCLETVKVEPTKVIIVEGILIFENKELLDLFDIKVFIDTDADVRIIRRIQRDVRERGRSLDSVINQYLTTVKLMHEQFVEPSKKNADIIIPEGGYNSVALRMLSDRIKSLLKGESE